MVASVNFLEEFGNILNKKILESEEIDWAKNNFYTIEKGGLPLKFEIKGNNYPKKAILFLISKDWAGLVDFVMGIIHSYDFNIDFVTAFNSQSSKYAIIKAIFRINDERLEKRAQELKNKLKYMLKDAIRGSKSIRELAYLSAKKFEIFEEIKNIFDKTIKDVEISKDIKKEGGELEKFIISRSVRYLMERNPEDLAKIVYWQYILQKKVREEGGIYIHVDNIKTKDEILTCILAVGKWNEISLSEVLETIREYLEDFERKFDKSFLTPDGIKVIRLEIVDGKGKALPDWEIPLFESFLRSKLKGKVLKCEPEYKFSFEQVWRVLLPTIVKEAKQTHKTHISFLPWLIHRREGDLKAIIIVPNFKDINEIENKKLDLIKKLNQIEGLYVYSSRPVNFVEGVGIIFLGVKTDFTFYETEEKAYKKIREIISEIFGELRDFDETLRRFERIKYEEVIKKLGKEVPSVFSREIFSHLDDMHKINVTPEIMSEEIKFSYMLLKKFMESKDRSKLWWSIKKYRNYTFVGLIGDHGKIKVVDIMKRVQRWKPVVVRTEEFGGTLVLFVFKDLRNEDLRELENFIKEEVRGYESNFIGY